MLQFKSIPFECKADADTRRFKGYASIFNVVDHHGDLIPPGAFARSIKQKFTDLPDGKSKIKALWLHRDPIGMPEVIREDSKGLYVEARVSKTAKGDEALELIRDGVVDEMSIGYSAQEVTYIEKDVDGDHPEGLRRILKSVELFEFSPVVWGANDQTNVEAAGLSDVAMAFSAIEHALKSGELTEAQLARLRGLIPQSKADQTVQALKTTLAELREFTDSLEL